MANFCDTSHSASRGDRMYSMYAILSQRPSVLIKESWTPQAAAVVAAPMESYDPNTLCLLLPEPLSIELVMVLLSRTCHRKNERMGWHADHA